MFAAWMRIDQRNPDSLLSRRNFAVAAGSEGSSRFQNRLVQRGGPIFDHKDKLDTPSRKFLRNRIARISRPHVADKDMMIDVALPAQYGPGPPTLDYVATPSTLLLGLFLQDIWSPPRTSSPSSLAPLGVCFAYIGVFLRWSAAGSSLP